MHEKPEHAYRQSWMKHCGSEEAATDRGCRDDDMDVLRLEQEAALLKEEGQVAGKWTERAAL